MAKQPAKAKPMRRGPRIVDKTPQTIEEATVLVSRISRLVEEVEGKRKAAEPRIAKLLTAAAKRKTDTEALVAPLIEEAKELAALVRGFAASHRDELTKSGKSLTVKLPTGDSLRWRTFPPSVFKIDEDAFFDEVREHGVEFEELFIRATEAPDREALLAHRDKTALLSSVAIGSRQVFEIVPERTDNRFAIVLTDRRPKWKLEPPPKEKKKKAKK